MATKFKITDIDSEDISAIQGAIELISRSMITRSYRTKKEGDIEIEDFDDFSIDYRCKLLASLMKIRKRVSNVKTTEDIVSVNIRHT